VITLFACRLTADLQEWWYSKQPASREPGNGTPPAPDQAS